MAVAKTLIDESAGKPKQVYLRRASSTIYYAMFHTITNCCANLLIGTPGRHTSKHAWLEAYRGLDHGTAKNRCQHASVMNNFSVPIRQFATHFVTMQSIRHDADYNPRATFLKSDVISNFDMAETAIEDFMKEPAKDRRAFSFFLLMKDRRA